MTTLSIEQTTNYNLELGDVPVMKYNPANCTLSSVVSGLTLKMGLGSVDYLHEHLLTEARTQVDIKLATEEIYWNTTSVCQWMTLPTIADYENMENLYDVEEVDRLLYQASKKFSW